MKKKSTMFLLMAICLVFGVSQMAFSQDVPADQDTILIPGGIDNAGLLETTINNDVDGDGVRINPKRVYKLEAGNIHVQVSEIIFGSEQDTSSTLIIVGEKGKIKPMVLMSPPSGVVDFSNQISGNLTLKHVYWPSMNLAGNCNTVWFIKTMNKRIELFDIVGENQTNQFFLYAVDSKGPLSLFIKECYFRDYTSFANGWQNMVIFRTGGGEPMDTVWIENTTVVNAGMPFMGKQIPVKFGYINHNTIINTSKYPIWFDKFKEGYVTNNLFINANYEGECQSTWGGQLAADGSKNGIINIDTIKVSNWEKHFPEIPLPKLEDVKFIASNNLHYYSPYLDKYFTGGYNDVADKPLSNRDWAADVNAEDLPITVDNAPMPLFGERTISILADYANIKEDNNYVLDTDPQMKTKGMASQEVGDQFAHFCRKNYGVAKEGETFDKTMMFVGDMDPNTIPGSELESGDAGFTSVTEFPEDYSYTADIKSTIDGKPLGSLLWWPGKLANYDSKAALARVKEYYETQEPLSKISTQLRSSRIYPVPANDFVKISSKNQIDRVVIYDLLGQQVAKYKIYSKSNENRIDLVDIKSGAYIMKIEFENGNVDTSRFLKN